MTTVTLDEIVCECCGCPFSVRPGAIDFSVHETTILCDMCRRNVSAGFLRVEYVRGRKRYRQWHPQPMTPGELLPEVKPFAA